jgi:hypothetical protein
MTWIGIEPGSLSFQSGDELSGLCYGY